MKIRSLDQSLSVSWSEAKRSTPIISAPTIEESDTDLQVSFQNVEIREYNVTVGDNPSCTKGVPISIGWKYNEHNVALDDYETARPSEDRRTQRQMFLPSKERDSMLREAGVARSSMAKAIRETSRIKSKRAQTVNNMGTTHRLEQGLESGLRKLKRAVFRRKKDSEEWEEWKKDFQKKAREEESRFINDAVPVVYKVNHPVPNHSKRITIEEDDIGLPPNTGDAKVPVLVEVHDCANDIQTSLSADDFEDTTATTVEMSNELKEISSSSDDDKLQTAPSGDEMEDTIANKAEGSNEDTAIRLTCVVDANKSSPVTPTSSERNQESSTTDVNVFSQGGQVLPKKPTSNAKHIPVKPSKVTPIEMHGAISEKIYLESTQSTLDVMSDQSNTSLIHSTDVEKLKSKDECKTQ